MKWNKEYRSTYPEALKLNPSLFQIVKNNYVCRVQGEGRRTAYNLHQKKIKEVDILLTWIKNILPRIAYEYTQGGDDKCTMEQVGFNVNSFMINACWGIIYNKGEGVVKHNHFPYALNFVYCVNLPKKSSPLVIEGRKIKQTAGEVIFFLPHQYHWVEPSKSDGKCVITGNILYGSNKPKEPD